MEQTVLDSPYDRNRMQTMFATLDGVCTFQKLEMPKRSSREHGLALWWKKLKAQARRDAVAVARNLNPQRAESPRLPRDAARWRAPNPEGSAEFFALLDGMGARHQAAARRDDLINALEASIGERRVMGAKGK